MKRNASSVLEVRPLHDRVIVQRLAGEPTSKEGVTVAKEIELEDRLENLGAQMVKEVASNTSDVAGDGTTTATVLARGIMAEGTRMVAAGHDPMALKRGIDRAAARVVESLVASSRNVKGRQEIAQVGAISANGDSTIGDIMAEAMDKVGKDGVIDPIKVVRTGLLNAALVAGLLLTAEAAISEKPPETDAMHGRDII